MDGDAGPGQLNSADNDGAEHDEAVTASDDPGTPDVDQPIDGSPSTNVKRSSFARMLRRDKTPSAASADDVTPELPSAAVELDKASSAVELEKPSAAVELDKVADEPSEPVAAAPVSSTAATATADEPDESEPAVDESGDAESADAETVDVETLAEPVPEPEPETSRLGTRWVAAIAATLVVLAGALAGGGYVALRTHDRTVAQAQAEAQAVQAAKDCVAATQAPDPSTMLASQQRIYDCLTGDYAVQAGLMVGVLADAYQVAQATVEIDNLRAAVENHLPDGTVQVLVAVQVKITNSQGEATQGYRLRVFMQPVDGTYKIGRLDQVAS